MRALKALVIGMGILIIAGTAVLAVMLGLRSSGDTMSTASPARVDLPAGARVVETALDGDRLALRLALAGGGERVIVIDARTGRHIGIVDLHAPPRAAPNRP